MRFTYSEAGGNDAGRGRLAPPPYESLCLPCIAALTSGVTATAAMTDYTGKDISAEYQTR
jgi:hypothetical protein